jgi:hypothetical protein
MSEKFNRDLTAAFMLVRELRYKALRQGLDPRATRVAIKCMLMIDTKAAKESWLTDSEDLQLDEIAQKLFMDMLKSYGLGG